MADYDFYIYTDRSKLRTTSKTEYRVKKLLRLKDLKPAIKCKLFIIRNNDYELL